ncbi:MAG: hypothetical protein CMJ33_03010, partial [Phycisphaerae bacterium]|nr:hypothetical protein [Phycisphaerae bacterium]
QQNQDQQNQDQQEQDRQEQDPDDSENAGSEADEGASRNSSNKEGKSMRMTREQAEALLQMIRDKEKERRELLAAREAREAARKKTPVEKDW